MKKIVFIALCTLFSLYSNAQAVDSLRIRDTRDIRRSPSSYKKTAQFEFKHNNSISLSNFSGYSGLLTIAPWSDDSGGPNHQLVFFRSGLFYRMGYTGVNNPQNEDKWNPWGKLIIGDINGIIPNKLEVNGTIRAKEVKIEATGWADFVFQPGYQLKPLSEVEHHIKEHKHLPDIPSEAEVKENGISVGEMQAKLLQKIEELTLYVIEQNKKIEEQNSKMEELKKENEQQQNKISSLEDELINLKNR